MLILSRLVDKHGRHRQFLFLIGWFLKNLLCKKKDKSCLNIDICIQNAVISIKISELNYRYMPLKPLNQMNWNLVGSIYGRSSIKKKSLRPNPLTNMAATGNTCFWLANFYTPVCKTECIMVYHCPSVLHVVL